MAQPGLSTTVQDHGRIGYYDIGIPPSGALDQYSLLAANLLVGNPDEAAALEGVYLGPELRFTAPTVVAVTGARCPPAQRRSAAAVGGLPRGRGDVVGFAYLTAGARAYLAVAGGIDVEPVLGSRSTYAPRRHGRATRAGRCRPAMHPDSPGAKVAPGRSVPADLRPQLGSAAEIRVVMGLYDHRLRGGYATAATPISGDLDRVAQSAPNTKTRFVEVDLDEALAARKEYRARIGRMRESLG